MPVRKVKGGYKGLNGKVFKTKKKALAQMRAARANGWNGK